MSAGPCQHGILRAGLNIFMLVFGSYHLVFVVQISWPQLSDISGSVQMSVLPTCCSASECQFPHECRPLPARCTESWPEYFHVGIWQLPSSNCGTNFMASAQRHRWQRTDKCFSAYVAQLQHVSLRMSAGPCQHAILRAGLNIFMLVFGNYHLVFVVQISWPQLSDISGSVQMSVLPTCCSASECQFPHECRPLPARCTESWPECFHVGIRQLPSSICGTNFMTSAQRHRWQRTDKCFSAYVAQLQNVSLRMSAGPCQHGILRACLNIFMLVFGSYHLVFVVQISWPQLSDISGSVQMSVLPTCCSASECQFPHECRPLPARYTESWPEYFHVGIWQLPSSICGTNFMTSAQRHRWQRTDKCFSADVAQLQTVCFSI